MVVYQSSRIGYYIYSVLFPTVIYFILNKVGYGLAYTIVNAQLLAILCIASVWGIFIRQKRFIIVYLLIYILYFTIDSLIQRNSFLSRWIEYKNAFVFFLWGVMLINDIKNNRVSVRSLRKFMVSFVVFESVISLLQYVIEPFRNFFRISYIRGGEMVEASDLERSGFMFGTFRSGSELALFMATFFIVLAIFYFSNNKVSLKSFLLLFLVEFIILLSGIRAALFFSIVFMFVAALQFRQRKVVLGVIAAGALSVLGGLSFGHVDNLRRVGFEDGGIARSLTIFNSFSGDALSQQTTFALTLNMMPYVIQNPLIGIGLHAHGGYILEHWGVALEDFSITDAMFSYVIAEIGIIGLIVFIMPLWFFMRFSSVIGCNKQNYLLFFIYLLLSTIMDSGIMADTNLIFFFFCIVFFVGYNTVNFSTNNQYAAINH